MYLVKVKLAAKLFTPDQWPSQSTLVTANRDPDPGIYRGRSGTRALQRRPRRALRSKEHLWQANRLTTIVPTIYISGVSTKVIQGLLALQYAACQRLGVVLGSFADYGVTKQYADTKTQWMLPALLQLLPAAL